MGSLDTLSKINKKELEKKLYVTRKAQVSTVKDGVDNVSRPHVNTINRIIDRITSNLDDAITGISTSAMQDTISGYKQSDSYTDAKLSGATDSLKSEVSDCNKKITELDSEISSLKIKYSEQLSAEAEAAKRAAEAAQEVLKNATSLVTKVVH